MFVSKVNMELMCPLSGNFRKKFYVCSIYKYELNICIIQFCEAQMGSVRFILQLKGSLEASSLRTPGSQVDPFVHCDCLKDLI